MRQPTHRELQDPVGLQRYLDDVAMEHSRLSEQLQETKGKVDEQLPLPSFKRIRDALSSGGEAPLGLDGLTGQSLTAQNSVATLTSTLPDPNDYPAGYLLATTTDPYILYLRTDAAPPIWTQLGAVASVSGKTGTVALGSVDLTDTSNVALLNRDAQVFTGTNTFSVAAGVNLSLEKSNNQPIMKFKGTATNDQYFGIVADALTFLKNDAATAIIAISQAGNIAIGTTVSASVRLRVSGASTTSADYAFAAQDSGGNNLLVARNDGNVGIGTVPIVRLHIGAGGTGTQAEGFIIDAGSGAGGVPYLQFSRNGIAKGYLSISGSSGGQIAGDVANDMAIRNSQAINFSSDNGTTKHAWLSTSGYFFVQGLVATAVAANAGGGTICYGSTTASTVGAAGGASALPATPTGYIICNIAGTQFKIPYYAN